MEHSAEILEFENEIRQRFDEAKELAKRSSFWNDAGVLIAFSSNKTIDGLKSPLDNRVFPGIPPHVFEQMSRQSIFTAIALMAKYGTVDEFTSWASSSRLSLLDPSSYRFNFHNVEILGNLWFNIMRANQLLSCHRVLIKDKIYDDIFGDTRDTLKYGQLFVGDITQRSLIRFEALKTITPLPYRFESKSEGTIHSLCNYYCKLTSNYKEKLELAKIISFGYSLLLLSKIHQRQHPTQRATLMSLAAIHRNLCDVSLEILSANNEEQLLNTEVDQPLFYRAYDSVCKVLNLLESLDKPSFENDVTELLEKYTYDPKLNADPLVSLPNNHVILKAGSDGCVFFDDVNELIPVMVIDYLLDRGELRNLQGESFRQYVESIIAKHGLSPFRVNRVIENGALISDVDVGFVKDRYLCLVECKDIIPYPTLAWDKEDEIRRMITHRKQGYMGWLNNSNALQKYFQDELNLKKLAREKGFNFNQIKGILGIVVTNRPIFIYLTDDIMLTNSIPRVMIIDEFDGLLLSEWHKLLPQSILSIAK